MTKVGSPSLTAVSPQARPASPSKHPDQTPQNKGKETLALSEDNIAARSSSPSADKQQISSQNNARKTPENHETRDNKTLTDEVPAKFTSKRNAARYADDNNWTFEMRNNTYLFYLKP
jgi:hypothetical protein